MVEHAETDEAILDCYDVMAELRPQIARDAFLPTVRAMQKDGLRLACIREDGRVVAVAGYRLSTNLFCGRHLYVDDLVTAESARSKGHGKALLAWLRARAVDEDCEILHLDSGVQRKRAHEFYLREGLELASYHFSERLKPARLTVRANDPLPALAPPRALTRATLAAGVSALARIDPDLAALAVKNGLPPMWARRPGFQTLVHIVLEQQVSIAAARTLFRRVCEHLGGMTPELVAEHGVLALHRLGLTRQKAAYCHALALAVMDGSLSLTRIAGSQDLEGRSALLELRGIGPWSADIYYLMALRRPDVWPVGDLALSVALHEVKRLRRRPDAERQLAMSAAWAPWRSVAARLLWHYYLTTRRTRAN